MAGTLDQQTSQIDVAGLSDAELRIAISRLTASRSQTEITTDVTALLEAFLATQGQHERQSRKMADSRDLHQGLRLRILRLAELLDLSIVLLDLERHLGDLLEHRPKCLCQPRRHHGNAPLGEAAG